MCCYLCEALTKGVEEHLVADIILQDGLSLRNTPHCCPVPIHIANPITHGDTEGRGQYGGVARVNEDIALCSQVDQALSGQLNGANLQEYVNHTDQEIIP